MDLSWEDHDTYVVSLGGKELKRYWFVLRCSLHSQSLQLVHSYGVWLRVLPSLCVSHSSVTPVQRESRN